MTNLTIQFHFCVIVLSLWSVCSWFGDRALTYCDILYSDNRSVYSSEFALCALVSLCKCTVLSTLELCVLLSTCVAFCVAHGLCLYQPCAFLLFLVAV